MNAFSMTNRPRRLLALLGLTAFTSLTACAQMTSPNQRADAPLTHAQVDLPKYMGEWYIVANIPYFLEKDLVASKTRYALRPDGKVTETFSAIKGGFDGDPKQYEFVDTPDPTTNNAYWSVRLFWPIYVSQTTIYVDDDYQYTLIGYKDKSLGWIFARKPELPEAKYQELLKRFAAEGYDTSKFRRVPQKREEIGKPGFHSPGDKT
jgi:apolipoprotein D and lipocalin family protein